MCDGRCVSEKQDRSKSESLELLRNIHGALVFYSGLCQISSLKSKFYISGLLLLGSDTAPGDDPCHGQPV